MVGPIRRMFAEAARQRLPRPIGSLACSTRTTAPWNQWRKCCSEFWKAIAVLADAVLVHLLEAWRFAGSHPL